MEKQNKRAVIVGIFVFLALVIFVLGVMTLGGQKSLFNRGATINVVFNEVNGLQTGNNVWYAGVKVGTIREIVITPDGRVKVEMNIEKDHLNIIKKDSKAKVGSDGFIGNKLVIIYGGSPASPVVEDGNSLAAGTSLNMDDMLATLQGNNQNLLAITNNFKTLSEDLVGGKGSIGKMLKDDQLFNDLQNSVTSIRLAAANAQQMVANVSDYTTRLTAKGSLANDLATDTVIFARLRNTVREINALSGKANEVITALNEASSNINQKLNDNTSPAGLLLNDKETAANLKATIRNLQTGSQKLDENMEALQHNFFFRGFFKNKNKAK